MTPIILNLKPSTREKLSSQPDEPDKKFELLKVFRTALERIITPCRDADRRDDDPVASPVFFPPPIISAAWARRKY